jgi:hypothetical protein
MASCRRKSPDPVIGKALTSVGRRWAACWLCGKIAVDAQSHKVPQGEAPAAPAGQTVPFEQAGKSRQLIKFFEEDCPRAGSGKRGWIYDGEDTR